MNANLPQDFLQVEVFSFLRRRSTSGSGRRELTATAGRKGHIMEHCTVLLVVESDGLAFELDTFIREDHRSWSVLLARSVDDAHAAILAGSVQLAIVSIPPSDRVDELIDALRAQHIPALRFTATACPTCGDGLEALSLPFAADPTRTALARLGMLAS